MSAANCCWCGTHNLGHRRSLTALTHLLLCLGFIIFMPFLQVEVPLPLGSSRLSSPLLATASAAAVTGGAVMWNPQWSAAVVTSALAAMYASSLQSSGHHNTIRSADSPCISLLPSLSSVCLRREIQEALWTAGVVMAGGTFRGWPALSPLSDATPYRSPQCSLAPHPSPSGLLMWVSFRIKAQTCDKQTVAPRVKRPFFFFFFLVIYLLTPIFFSCVDELRTGGKRVPYFSICKNSFIRKEKIYVWKRVICLGSLESLGKMSVTKEKKKVFLKSFSLGSITKVYFFCFFSSLGFTYFFSFSYVFTDGK